MPPGLSPQHLAQLAALTVCDGLTLLSTGKRVCFSCAHVFRVEENEVGCKIFLAHPNVHSLDVKEGIEKVLKEIGWEEDSGIVQARGDASGLHV